MTLDRFLRLAQIVSNTIWTRSYLASWPGQMVLEMNYRPQAFRLGAVS